MKLAAAEDRQVNPFVDRFDPARLDFRFALPVRLLFQAPDMTQRTYRLPNVRIFQMPPRNSA
jgi:hypothetical protein